MAFALAHRVLLLVSKEGIGIDIALSALPFEAAMIGRSTSFEFMPRLKLRTCSAEDLIVMKAFADRPRDWADVEGILVRRKGRLNWSYIKNKLKPLIELKHAPEILNKLNFLKQKS